MTPPAPRKLLLAVQDERLRERLERLLRAEDIDVEHDPTVATDAPSEIDADLIVLRAEGLDSDALPDVLTAAQGEDAPGVVVLGDEGSALDEVELVAAGASAVLDSSRGRLVEQLVELVEAEAGGGLDGPEASGAVAEPKLADFQSRSATMRDFLDVVRRVASSDSTLLVMGETGVGKERLARAIHAESARAPGPFVAINCGALPENLLESELFGHIKGAFTGATSTRQGHFEAADCGTLFLDEVGEMPAHLQVKLLTVLQRHEVQPLGADKPRPVDVRILAATNRDLEQDVAEGRFREDLFFRLNVVSLEIPPLRERLEDLPWLLGRFIRHFAVAHGRSDVRGVRERALRRLLAYSWPGNVRELVNVIERAVLLTEGEWVGLEDLPENVRGALGRPAAEPGGGSGSAAGSEASDALLELPLAEARRQTLERFEHTYLDHLLRACGGRVGDVAGRAGINPRTLYEKMRRLGLRKEDYR